MFTLLTLRVDGSLANKVFNSAEVTPSILLAAIEAFISKSYVKLVLVKSLIVGMAYDNQRNRDLKYLMPVVKRPLQVAA